MFKLGLMPANQNDRPIPPECALESSSVNCCENLEKVAAFAREPSSPLSLRVDTVSADKQVEN